jgi:hypothetical protein
VLLIAPFAPSVSCGIEGQATLQVELPDWAVEPLFPQSGVRTEKTVLDAVSKTDGTSVRPIRSTN